MGNFLTEHHETIGHEGFYSCDAEDAGKETVWGISRVFNAKEDIWQLVDAYKGEGFPANMENDPVIKQKALDIAKRSYWDPVRGDEVISQAICQALFDASYNLGPEESILFMQQALNSLNNDGKIYVDIKESGKFDDDTMAALNALVTGVEDGRFALWLAMVSFKAVHYLTKSKEKYVKGLVLNRTFAPETLLRLFPNRFEGRLPH